MWNIVRPNCQCQSFAESPPFAEVTQIQVILISHRLVRTTRATEQFGIPPDLPKTPCECRTNSRVDDDGRNPDGACDFFFSTPGRILVLLGSPLMVKYLIVPYNA